MRSAAHRIRDTQRTTGGARLAPRPPRPGVELDGGQSCRGTQAHSVPVNTLPTAIPARVPISDAPSADLPPGQARSETQKPRAGGDPLPADHLRRDTHSQPIGGNPHDALLLILADALDDLESARIATQNRLRSLGEVKGLGGSREARTMHHIADTLAELERAAILDLQRAVRAHPLGPWVKRTTGVGEKQGARLLAAIGDPAERARPSQLWQYCGHGAPSKLARGVKTFWNPTAKMRVHRVAEAIVHTGVRKLDGCDDTEGYDYRRRIALTPLAAVYLAARADWAGREACPSCKGVCTDGHKHNHALRMVGKALLLDLWRETRAVGEP